jgi:hypothetical protein
MTFENRLLEHFTAMNNDPRVMAEMIDMEAVEREIGNFIEPLPTFTFQVNVMDRYGNALGEIRGA